MLDFYLGSVIVWFIILVSSVIVCSGRIIKNGWVEAGVKPVTVKGLLYTLLIAAVPIFRILICAAAFLMATISKDEYNKEFKDDKNERLEQD